MKRRAEYAQLEHQYWRKVCFNACVYNEEWIEEKMSKDESKSFINEVKEFFKSADTVEGDGDFKTLRNASEKEQNTVLIAKRKPAPVEVNKYSDDYLHTHSNDIMERYGVNELLLAVNKASCGDVGQGLTCLSTSPNGFYCAAGTCNGRILVWDLRLSVLQSSVSSSTFEMSEDAFRHRTM